MLERGRLELDDEVSAYLSRRKLLDLATDAGWFAIPRVDAQRALVDEMRDLVGIDALRLSGLVNDSATMFRHPANRLAIPWRAHGIDGLVVTLQRRALDASEPRYVFPAGRSPSAPFVVVEDLEELESSTPIMLVEGAVDVIAARWVLRDKQRDGLVLGLPGVNNWRAEWTDMLFGREVIIAFDVDKAGETGADRILALCTHAKNVTRRRPRGARDWGAKLEAVRT
jgi:DNA primase